MTDLDIIREQLEEIETLQRQVQRLRRPHNQVRRQGLIGGFVLAGLLAIPALML